MAALIACCLVIFICGFTAGLMTAEAFDRVLTGQSKKAIKPLAIATYAVVVAAASTMLIVTGV